jgi:hypothetical protein
LFKDKISLDAIIGTARVFSASLMTSGIRFLGRLKRAAVTRQTEEKKVK